MRAFRDYEPIPSAFSVSHVGTLDIEFDDDHVTLTGPVSCVGQLEMDEEALM